MNLFNSVDSVPKLKVVGWRYWRQSATDADGKERRKFKHVTHKNVKKKQEQST